MTARKIVQLVANQPTSADVYCAVWARMNEGVRFAVRANEVHYLKTIALGLDDDLTSLLLLKKLAVAEKLEQPGSDDGVAAMNSYVEFRFGSADRQVRQLVHPSMCRVPHALSVSTRLGAGLVSVRDGEVLMWPDDAGCLRELHIVRSSPPGPANDENPPPIAG
jgi:hypothetical protein